jgi:hypothetical protein
MQRDPNSPGPDEVRNPRVGRPLGIGGRHSRQQSYHHEQKPKTLFHGATEVDLELLTSAMTRTITIA